VAYDATALSKVAELDARNSLWYYVTVDPAATVDTSGYFNSAYDQLRLGDVILRSTRTSTITGAVAAMGLHFVIDRAASVVDVADALAFTVTDTD
jgi:NADH:ubiquinone oxidoreductase subunit B-like Fe-S oxidoreductase